VSTRPHAATGARAARSAGVNKTCDASATGSCTSRGSVATLKSPQSTSNSSGRCRVSKYARSCSSQASFPV
jgi:hypothetical protein